MLALLAMVVFIGCWSMSMGTSPFTRAPIKDPDDAMRLVQVRDLIDGAGWYNLTQGRVNPPQGLDMHWSRLPDLPLAASILVIEHFVTDRETAIALAAWIVPPLIGIGFFYAFVWATAPLVRPNGIVFTGLVGITLWLPLCQFASGRVDHHGWQLVFAAITSGAVIRIILKPETRGMAVLGGLVGTLGLWVGAEAVPWVGLAAVALTLNWIRHGSPGGNVLALYGVTLLLTSTLLLPIVVPSVRLTAPACDAFSIVSLGLAGSITLLGFGAAVTDRLQPLGKPMTRLALCLIIGAAALTALQFVFPECRHGPFSQVPPDIAFWIKTVKESQPLAAIMEYDPGIAAAEVVLPVLSVVMTLAVAARTRGKQRTLWLALGLWTTAGIVLMLWQVRTVFLANLYAGLSLAWLAAYAGESAEGASRSITRIILSIAVPLTVAVLPPLADLGAESAAGSMTMKTASIPCDPEPAVAAFEQRSGDGPPLLLGADIDLGPTLLLLTPHMVLGAPYHRSTAGLVDIHRLLYSDERSAIEVVSRRGVDAIVLCPLDSLTPDEVPTPFSRQLLSGNVPPWLRKLPDTGEVTVFWVDHDRLAAPLKK